MALPGNLRDVTAGTRASVPLAALALMLSLAACGDDEPSSSETAPAQSTVEAPVATGPAATEASPEAAAPVETGELSDADEAAVTEAVSGVSSWPRQTCDKARANWVPRHSEDDRNDRCRLLCRDNGATRR